MYTGRYNHVHCDASNYCLVLFLFSRPRISALGEVLNEVHEINRRFQPFLERYQQLLLDDPELSEQVSTNFILYMYYFIM